MIRVVTTAASRPVAAWVPLTKLYSPCQTATSKMLPPDRLYSQVRTTAPQVSPQKHAHVLGRGEVPVGGDHQELRQVPAEPQHGQDERAGQRAEPALQLRQRVSAPAGLLAHGADEDDQQHTGQADRRGPATCGPCWLLRVAGDPAPVLAAIQAQPWATRAEYLGGSELRVDATSLDAGEHGIPAALAACGARQVSCEPLAADLESAFLALTKDNR